jgi:hypothetical protein
MRHIILEKLAAELSLPITTERQVVYILVEIRKLLELGQKSNGCDSLRFCCDWVVHTLLSGKMARSVVAKFENVHQQQEKLSHAKDGQKVLLDWEFLAEFDLVISFATFRHQLTEFFRENHLDPSRVTADGNWTLFLIQFVAVVEDCPLRFVAPAHEHAEVVVLSVADVRSDEDAKKVGYKFALQWSSRSRKTGEELIHQKFFGI